MNLQFRSATQADIPVIRSWLKKEALVWQDVEQTWPTIFLAFQQDQLVGFGGMEIHGTFGLLRSMVVLPAFRGKGYGQSICQWLLQKAWDNQLQAVYLLTETASGFFGKLGFQSLPREEVPLHIQQSEEFARLCPQSATCMVYFNPQITKQP